MPSAQEVREARRRRILARGTDGLAFIAGELPAVSAPGLRPSNAVESSSASESAFLSTAVPRGGRAAPTRSSHTSSSGNPPELDHEDEERLIQDVGEDETALQDGQGPTVIEEVIKLDAVSSQTSNDVNLTCLDENIDQRGTNSTEEGWSATSRVTWDGITRAIDATENFRAFGAILLALLAVMQSYFSWTNLEGKFDRNWALPWPVGLVLVTDVSLIVAALFLGFVRIPSLMKPVDVPKGSTLQDQLSKLGDVSLQLGRLLGLGTVIFKATRALFLDCSIYAITLVSGYTLAQNWHSAFVAPNS